MSPRLWRRVVLLLVMIATAACTTSEPVEEELQAEGIREERLSAVGNHFGYAVAVSGDSALISHPHDAGAGPYFGAVYVYERQKDVWIEVATLLPDDDSETDAFGIAVALDTHVAIVGAAEATPLGAAYLFERLEGVWTQVQKLTADDVNGHTGFGLSVAISGDYALVGAPGDDEAGAQAGAVYVFQRQGGVWREQAVQKLFAHDAREASRFGASVAIAGPYAIVGAPMHDDNGGYHDDYGAAYVFEWYRDGWVEVEKLQASDRAVRDDFGSAVAVSGSEALVGAPNHEGHGAAYLFERQTGIWAATEVHKLTAQGTLGSQFGAAVALSGDVILVGAYADDTGYTEADGAHTEWHSSGAAYLFRRHIKGWIESVKLPMHNDRHPSHFGHAVALLGPHALVGAPAILGGTDGHVYAYSGVIPGVTPEILSAPITTATAGELYTYTVQATDADGDPLLYRLTHAPGGMTIHDTRGLITWTPQAAGDVFIALEVRDGHGGVATQAYPIHVVAPQPSVTPPPPTAAVNQPPSITSTPITQARRFHIIPQITVIDAHTVEQTITLNGYPYTPGTAITAAGPYELTVEATDVAGNTTVTTMRFTLERTPSPE